MDKEWEGLHFDFTADKGSFLLIERNPPWRRMDLSAIELQMMTNNRIPRLLPLYQEEIDGNVRLLFDIQGKKKLVQRLRLERLSQKQYLNMMLQAISAISDCGGYMLNEKGVVLRADYIFTGENVTDLYFPFLPVHSLPVKVTMLDQLRAFSSVCLASVDSMEGSKIPRVLAGLQEESMRYAEWKEILLSLITDDSRIPFPIPEERDPPPPKQAEAPRIHTNRPAWVPALVSKEVAAAQDITPVRVDVPLPKPTRLPVKAHERPLSWLMRVKELKDEIGTTVDTGELPGPPIAEERSVGPSANGSRTADWKRLGYVTAAGLALIGLIWSFYSDTSSFTAIAIMAGLSALVMFGLLWMYKERFPGLPGTMKPDKSGPIEEDETAWEGVAHRFFQEEQEGWNPYGLPKPTEPEVTKENTATAFARQVGFSALPQHPPLGTILLDPASLQSHGDARTPRYRLEVTHEAGSGTIELGQGAYMIGRSDGRADYHLDVPGVSKHHVELVCREGQYYAQDLGSTNGTLLNSERMAPYKPYLLKPADHLSVIGAQFVFKAD